MRGKRKIGGMIDDLPGLFDDIDISRDDIAGSLIAQSLNSGKVDNDDIDALDPDTINNNVTPLRILSFGSGSSGNCTYIGNDSAGVLIDAGVDNDFVTEQLLKNGIDISAVKGILLTHDHSDHVKYAYTILRRNKHMRIYCTPKTLNGLLRRHSISRRIKDYHVGVFKEFAFEVAGLNITPFEVSHDGTDNVGFAIESAGRRVTIVTDTGYITPRAEYYLHGADAIILESNYDLSMLEHGPYPEYLKARIKSATGHLDNAEAASFLTQLVKKSAPSLIILCHLSADNNEPALAMECVRKAINDAGVEVTTSDDNSGHLRLAVLPRFGCSPLFTVNASSRHQ